MYKETSITDPALQVEVDRREKRLQDLEALIHRIASASPADREQAVEDLISNLDGAPQIQNPMDEPTTSVTISQTVGAHANELSVDDDGNVQYYGTTSRYHSTPFHPDPSSPDEAEEQYHRKWLRSNLRFQQTCEARALERLRTGDIACGIDPDVASTLLEIYWTWQAPLHNCIYRRCTSQYLLWVAQTC